MKDISITREMLEAVAFAQLYREDATLSLRKLVTTKLTSRELEQLYKDILRHPDFQEVKKDILKLEKATLVEDDSDTIMLFYNKLLKDAQEEKKYEVAARILGEIRKLKAIDDAEQKFEIFITVKPPANNSNNNSSSGSKDTT